MNNIHFITSLNKSLRKHKEFFISSCNQFIRDVKGTYKEIIVRNQMIGVDTEIGVAEYSSVIKRTVLDKKNFVYNPNNTVPMNFKYNEIRVALLKPEQFSTPEWGTDLYEKAIQENNGLNRKSYEMFWSHEGGDVYKDLAAFSTFEDYSVSYEDLYKVQISEKVNVEGWINYYNQLLEHFFKGFDRKLNKNGVVIYYKELGADSIFGIRYDIKKYKSRLKKRGIDLPEDLEIVYGKDEKNISSLGIFANPLFYHPVYPLKSFKALDIAHSSSQNRPEEYLLRKKKSENNDTIISHPTTHGENLKKHTFIYMNALAESVKIYLDYIETCLLDVLQD